MANIERIEKFLIGGHQFSKNDYIAKYHFLLVGSMLVVGFLLSFIASLVRFFTESYFVATVDMLLSLSLFGLYYIFRKQKSAFNFISNIALGLLFVFFTIVVIVIEQEYSKLLWYPLLIIATFLIKGEKIGKMVFLIVTTTLVMLHHFSSVDIYLSNRDLIMTIVAYLAFSLFMTFSEHQHKKNINSIKERNKEIKRRKRMLYKLARTSDITQLSNKIVMDEDIKNSKGDISCIVLDIDDFDIIVHKFGVEFTDNLIREVAKTLKSLTTDSIDLYHIHNKRFAFLIKNYRENQDIDFVKNLKSLFSDIHIEHLSISFIIAIVRDKKSTLSHAGMTLREIKNGNQKNCMIYQYDPKQEQMQKNNLYWASRLGELMHKDKIVVYYQPIVDNDSKEVLKYECLVRAIDEDKVVTPYFFLSVAKSKGLLKNITQIVIDKSFKLFSKNSYDFSINITEQDLNENYLVDFLSQKAKEHNINPNRVFLEILENINVEDSKYADAQFKRLKELGFKLAIDDFGAEASNLSRLLTLKADIIKIDGQFIKNLDTDVESLKIVETIVSLAKKMNAKTVAEFVHNEEIYEIVKKLGVDFSQGYYFSPPLPQVAKESVDRLEKLCA